MHSPVAAVSQDPLVGDSAFAKQAVEGVTPLRPLLQEPVQDWPTGRLAQVDGQAWELVTWGVVGRPTQSANDSQDSATGQ
jgi:hypothetical protein